MRTLGGMLSLLLAACGGGAGRSADPPSVAEGDAFFNRGDYTGATSRYEAALQKSPNQPHVLLQLGMSWERLGVADRAIQYYERLLSTSPQATEAGTARPRRDRLVKLKDWDPTKGPTPAEILD